jgi:hypothetical protein
MRATILLTLLALTVQATAQDSEYKGDYFVNGSTMGTWLEGDSRVAALGYIQGVHDTMSVLGLLCSPDDVTADQLYKMLMKYIEDHPEKMHMPASSLVASALGVWSCEGGAERLGGILLGAEGSTDAVH